jgi:hypothetical protein
MAHLSEHTIDFRELVRLLLGSRKRKEKRIAWLYSLSKPFDNIHQQFLVWTDEQYEAVGYTGQVIALRAMLISTFGAGITISNSVPAKDLTVDDTIFSTSIGDTEYTYAIGETYTPTGFSFTLHVPIGLGLTAADLVKMRTLVERYNSNSFEIIVA